MKNLSSLLGIEQKFPGHPVRSLVYPVAIAAAVIVIIVVVVVIIIVVVVVIVIIVIIIIMLSRTWPRGQLLSRYYNPELFFTGRPGFFVPAGWTFTTAWEIWIIQCYLVVYLTWTGVLCSPVAPRR